MQLKRFQAPTVAHAYARVREALGEEAVIVSTRSASVPGLLGGSRREFVEVVAGVPQPGDAPGVAAAAAAEGVFPADLRVLAAAAAAAAPAMAVAGPATLDEPEIAPPFVNERAGSARRMPFEVYARAAGASLDAAGADGAEAKQEAPEAPATLVPLPAATGREAATVPSAPSARAEDPLLGAIAAQLAEVHALVGRLSLERLEERVQAGPAGLHDARARLEQQQVGTSVLIPVLDQVVDAVVPEASARQVLDTLQRKLAAQLPPVMRLSLKRGCTAVFVVGPGGSGRTSVAVRLGMELAQSRGARVTLASIDVNRAGAPQQITACGAAAGLPVRLCYAPGELKALLEDGSADVVIVDTPGHSGARSDRMAELKAFARVARERITLLTLPATGKAEDLRRVTGAFADAGVDGLVLTRCDETITFGALLTVACERRIAIAYTTHAEAIGEPLHAGDNQALALATLQGRWPQREQAAHVAARAR